MLFGALGDIHGDFDSTRLIMRRHPEVPFWLCVGDVADSQGRYEELDAPLFFIKGNNDNFDALAAPGSLPPRLHYIPNGQLIDVGATVPGGRLLVAGVGGTLAPTMYDLRAADLPHPKKGTAKATELADRRRHFVREEVEACKGMTGVDVLLTHEAPRPFRVGRMDAGKTPVNEAIAAIQPRLHLFGHHHRFAEQLVHGVRSVGLDLVSRSYLLVDGRTLAYAVNAVH